MYILGIPCHIVQRGNNRDATFFAEQDYQFYLKCLYDEASKKYNADVHAYALMTNHVHILMTPLLKESASLVMQSIATGDKKFQRHVEQVLNMKIGFVQRGKSLR